MAEFDAMEVFYNRTNIEEAMRFNIIDGLATFHAIVDSFQLLDISLPSSLQNALQDTEDLNMTIQTKEYEKEEVEEKAQG